MFTHHLFLFVFLLPLNAWAEVEKPVYTPPSPVISTEGVVQMIVGLLLVLAVIGVITWLLKRFAIIPTTAAGTLKVVAATGVGQRERVVIVEIENTWLVLGVAPGRVNRLHSMEKPVSDSGDKTLKTVSPDNFSTQLNQSMEKNNAQ